MNDTCRLAFIGDVMLGRGVSDELPHRPPESFWGSTLPTLLGADALIANLECAITPRTAPWTRTPKVFHFRADPRAVPVLQAARVRAVSLANNHTLDYGHDGLLDTLALLDEAGIAHAGAGEDLAAAMRPALFDAAGLRIGLIALTDNEPPFAASQTQPGTFFWPIRRRPDELAPVEQALDQARQAGAELVVLALHWGPNMVTRPCDEFRRFARAAIERGVNVVYGHSAHVFQAVERRNHGLILYDTGDFIDDYAVDPVLRNDWSFIFLVDVRVGPAPDARIQRLRMIPVRLRYATVDLATGAEADAIMQRMETLCGELGTTLTRTDRALELLAHEPVPER